MRSTIGTSLRAFPVAVSISLLLAGCATPGPTSTDRPEPSGSSSPSAVPAPTFDPSASAEDALALFDSVNRSTLATDADADGRAFIDGLVTAGFDRAAMQVTADQTTIGNAADSIQFSVRWGDDCLIGQNGPAVGGYHSTLAPVLGTGTCLIGSTRPIDW
ncbi:hypothetical protein [Mycetocola sp. 2940]|uniref:DUF6993 domain-containing protein n=1 Tax=Mycetocola sp. 2940 TaxID=3156452 RepID=UPI003398D65A